MMRHILKIYRRIQVAALAGIYPAIFFLSNNWHIFSLKQSVTLLIGTICFSLVILLSVAYALDFCLRILFKKWPFSTDASGAARSFLNPILTLIALLFCIYLLRNTLESIDINKISLYIIIAVIVFFFTGYAHKKGLKPIVNSLLILSALSIINLFANIYQQTSVPIEAWATRNKAAYDRITFRKSPNVYLIITESYSNKAALEAVYGIDNSPFYETMQELGVKLNHDHYSNYNHTLASLTSIFGMDHHYGLFEGRNFDSLGGRRLLEAKIYNPVIDVFRANRYKIQYLHSVSGLMPNGAEVDFCMPSPSFLNALEVFLTKQNIIALDAFNGKKTAPFDSIKRQITSTALEDNAYFNFIYVNFPGHSPSRIKDRSKMVVNQKLGKFRNAYGTQMESANRKLIELVRLIIDQDKDAIIILIGDHGSWGFRFRQDAQGKRIPHQLFILDRYGVLAGIRGPDALSGLMENGAIKTHVNLFRYLFAYLSDDETILKSVAADDSYDRKFIMAIKDGQILERFVKIKLTKKIKK